jgi:hypothetical protein
MAATRRYYAAFCGFYDLTERLISMHPEQVNRGRGHIRAPPQAALYKRHFRVANLLHKRGTIVDIRGVCERTLQAQHPGWDNLI